MSAGQGGAPRAVRGEENRSNDWAGGCSATLSQAQAAHRWASARAWSRAASRGAALRDPVNRAATIQLGLRAVQPYCAGPAVGSRAQRRPQSEQSWLRRFRVGELSGRICPLASVELARDDRARGDRLVYRLTAYASPLGEAGGVVERADEPVIDLDGR